MKAAKRRVAPKPKKPASQPRKRASKLTVASSSPLGLLALHLLKTRESQAKRALLFIAADERRAEHLGAICHAFAPGCDAMVLPPPDPWREAIPTDAAGRRAAVLRRLAEKPRGFIIATPEALLSSTPSPKAWRRAVIRLAPGDALDEEALKAQLERAGYRFEDRVDDAGSAALFGQVIDIFPAGDIAPARLHHDGGKITELFTYDPSTQRVTSSRDSVTIDLCSERLIEGEHKATLADYLRDPRVIADAGLASRLPAHAKPMSRLLEGAETLPASRDDEPRVPVFATARAPTRALRSFLAEQETARRRILFTAASGRDARILERRAGSIGDCWHSWAEASAIKPGKRAWLIADLERGFFAEGPATTVIAAADLLGSRAARLNPMAPLSAWAAPETGIAPGDVVVHLERGVGVMGGLETVSAPPLPDSDMVRLVFAGDASVLAPVSELAIIWRYSGEREGIVLDRPDGASWAERRREAEAEIAETAKRLSAIAAQRRAATAEKLIPPVADYERFAAGFPFAPTPDQARAIEDVLNDLASGKPMDRLVCGDVGYGKTEVALRAAAAAVFAGWQVAVAAPTTVLARQHVETFRKRFAPFGIEVGHLSRFVSAKEAAEVRKRLASGALRVVIGTHAIAAKGVRFKELGLLVLDEEQRFGAADKARLAGLGENVHVLTLTATPIPRTLSLAAIGLRSLSVIATPPARRVPVKTTVEPFDEVAIAEALRREKRRRGQSFVVVPRIEDIAAMEHRLKAIVPELDLRTIHGRMPAQSIDETMVRFAAGDGDVLLTTNIIESGLDLPRANTIVVWRPDRFGLAQLHQLRGRVGRGRAAGYAWFCTDPDAKLTSSAEKRLKVISELTQSGAGFAISDRDLDIRGAGDLLGEEQAGHVKLVGPSLYRHLLERAIASLRGEPRADDSLVELRLEVQGALPGSYIEDERARLALYERLFKAESETALDDLEEEMEDRFGPLPQAAKDLLAMERIRIACRALGITELDAGPNAIALRFSPAALQRADHPARDLADAEWVEGRLIVERPSEPAGRIAAVAQLLEELDERAAR